MYSNSALEQYKQCPLSYRFKYVLGLVKIEEEKIEHHLIYGRAMHKGLKRIYLGDSLEAAKEAFKAGYSKQLDEEDKAKTQANGLLVLDNYIRRWSEEDKKWKIIACEEKDRFEYAGDKEFAVIPDLVMENKQFGGIYGLDHKIVGGRKATLSYEFWTQFEPNSQVTKYCSYIKERYKDCSGFYINAIGMGHRSRAYKGEPAGFWYRFERQMFNRNEQQLEMEVKDSEYWIARIEQSQKENSYGMSTSICRWCEFRNICAAGWSWDTDKELILLQYQVAPRESEKEKEIQCLQEKI